MIKKYIPSVLWMVVIFVLSSIPGKQLPEMPFPGFDKIAHIGIYAILGFFLAGAFNGKILVIFIIGVVYGLFDEVHQILVPFREFSLLDLLSDAIGVVIGIICRQLLKKHKLGR